MTPTEHRDPFKKLVTTRRWVHRAPHILTLKILPRKILPRVV